MKNSFPIFIILLLFDSVEAFSADSIYVNTSNFLSPEELSLPKANIDGHGISIALQQGKYTFVELGMEKYWKQVKLINPRTTAVSLGATYNFLDNVIGANGNIWTRKGRINLTYGASAGIYSDFADLKRFAIGPTIGYRFLGFHVSGGFNFFLGNNALTEINRFYVSARYYIPLERDFNFK